MLLFCYKYNIFCLFVFRARVFLWSPGFQRTNSVDRAGLNHTELCLPLPSGAGFKDLCHLCHVAQIGQPNSLICLIFLTIPNFRLSVIFYPNSKFSYINIEFVKNCIDLPIKMELTFSKSSKNYYTTANILLLGSFRRLS